MDQNMSMILMLVLLFAMMYFLMIRPENKRKKKLQEMRESLKKGDTVTTIGGIVGKIVRITNDTIIFETSEDRVRIEVAKWAISTTGVQTEEQPVEKKEKKKAAEIPEEPEAPAAEKSDEQ
ncbi:MAG: preprotein translocase subunit YajC [Oscillospiraceae bacterium]|nr:preprotein translocase subunit YajC [Oscillospiraceae bacterium]